jgi:parallel beta helix pectate lyase-like protein
MILVGLLSSLAAPLVDAASQRTFVASNGLDTNPCSLSAPCRGFAAALAQTNAGGEIVVLDSGGYGAVTVNKAVSIISPPGVYAGISVFAGNNGVTINAGSTDEVILRGLVINNQGGDNGVVFNSGGALYIEGCTVRGFNGGGMANVNFAPTTSANLFVKDSFLRSGAAGIRASNSSGSASITVDNTRIESNAAGIAASYNGRLAVRNTIVSENTGNGVDLSTTASQVLDADLDNVLTSGNAGNAINVNGGSISVLLSNSTAQSNNIGVFVQGGSTAATARLTNNVITRNTTGIGTGAMGSILTPISNTIEGNGTNGIVSSNYPPK